MALDTDKLADWDGMKDDLEALLRKHYPQVLELAYGDAADLVGNTRDGATLVFDLSNPKIKKVLDKLAAQIRNVADTTKEQVRALVDRQTDEGWSMDELAKKVRDLGEDMSASRASTIARTESGTAYNLGALVSYQDAGVKTVEVLDGDDDEECSSVDGTTQSMDWAAENPLGHPNCTRAFSPVVDW